jgi:hypothetical protein
MCPRKQKNVVLVRIIGETMIEVGDLVRFKEDNYFINMKGIWLVIRVKMDPERGKLIYLTKGGRRAQARAHYLEKISSCRQQEKV